MLGVNREAFRKWNALTLGALGEAQSRVPGASGTLEGSGTTLKADLNRNKLQSAIIFKVPYAKRINDKKYRRKDGRKMQLKPVGEISYRVGKTIQTKYRKGEIGFLSNAINAFKPLFSKAAQDSVSKSFIDI